MKQYVTDTMALVSYIGKRKLPISAKQIFQMADLGQNEILIPAIVLVEVAWSGPHLTDTLLCECDN